jgi:hypothetical protein
MNNQADQPQGRLPIDAKKTGAACGVSLRTAVGRAIDLVLGWLAWLWQLAVALAGTTGPRASGALAP